MFQNVHRAGITTQIKSNHLSLCKHGFKYINDTGVVCRVLPTGMQIITHYITILPTIMPKTFNVTEFRKNENIHSRIYYQI